MKRILSGIVSLLLLTGSLSAQEPLVEIIFGPRDGDNAGTLYAYPASAIEVDVWIKTAEGISVIGFHLPLSSRVNLIVNRDGVEFDFYLLDNWFYVVYLEPNYDSEHPGYMNQSLLGLCCINPVYERGIHTEGEWFLIATFFTSTVIDGELDIPFCDALIEGFHPYNDSLVLPVYAIGELDPSQYTVQYACLEFLENPCGPYIVGDFNGSGEFNVADIIAAFSKLQTGSPEAGLVCECPPGSGNDWAVAMDANNSCAFNIADIIAGFSNLQTGSPELVPCEYCPPEGP